MQEMAQMQVGYAIVVVAGEQGGHGDDILGIVVAVPQTIPLLSFITNKTVRFCVFIFYRR